MDKQYLQSMARKWQRRARQLEGFRDDVSLPDNVRSDARGEARAYKRCADDLLQFAKALQGSVASEANESIEGKDVSHAF